MYEQAINTYFDDPAVERQLVDAVSRLVRIRSVKGEGGPGMPFGEGPAKALEEALKLCGELGFATENVDGYVGTADLGEGPAGLHILGHLDVVGEGTGWTVTGPYEPKVVDGVLYGRGVADDKGPVVAALFAMKAVKDLGIPLKQSVKLILGTDEESGSSDIAYYYKNHPYAPHTFTPDANFPLIHIEKGHYHPDFGASWPESAALPRVRALQGGFRNNVVPPEAGCTVAGLTAAQVEPAAEEGARRTGAAFTCTDGADGVQILCKGKNAHAASPDDGNNAISALLELLAALPLAQCGSTSALRALHTLFPHGDTRGRALGIAQADEESGELTLNLSLITLTETGFSAKFDVRFPLSSNEDNCKRACEASFARHGISVTGDPDMTTVHCVPADSPFVRTLLRCYETFTGEKDARPIAIGGGTYVHDIPGGVAFGCEMPGAQPNMHGADERIPVRDLITSAKIFALAIAGVCGETAGHTV